MIRVRENDLLQDGITKIFESLEVGSYIFVHGVGVENILKASGYYYKLEEILRQTWKVCALYPQQLKLIPKMDNSDKKVCFVVEKIKEFGD